MNQIESNINSTLPIEERKELQYKDLSKPDSKCDFFLLVLTQIILWGTIVYIVYDILKIKTYLPSILSFCGVYVLYIFTHCITPELKYLGNKIEDQSMSEIMLRYFKAVPKITIKTESYHLVGGKSLRRAVTHSEEEEFKYYSFRDISGLFTLDIPEKSNITLIKLEIINDINFADSMTYSDYVTKKKIYMNEIKIKIVLSNILKQELMIITKD